MKSFWRVVISWWSYGGLPPEHIYWSIAKISRTVDIFFQTTKPQNCIASTQSAPLRWLRRFSWWSQSGHPLQKNLIIPPVVISGCCIENQRFNVLLTTITPHSRLPSPWRFNRRQPTNSGSPPPPLVGGRIKIGSELGNIGRWVEWLWEWLENLPNLTSTPW